MGTTLWTETRERVLERDGRACTVRLLLGGECSGSLHVHHIIPRDEGGSDEPDNLIVSCAAHHPVLEAARRFLRDRRERERPRCRHRHATAEARRLCEARKARERLLAA